MNSDLVIGTAVDAVFVSGVDVLRATNDVVLDPSVSVDAGPVYPVVPVNPVFPV